jgi:hypothetical protein
VDELPSVDEKGEPPRRPEPDAAGVDRLEVLEHQVRQLMSRLAAWVESQLVQAVDDRRSDLRALRSELQTALTEQVAGVRAESASVLTVAIRRLSLNHEELAERLDDVAGRSAEAVAGAAALRLAAASDTGRLEALEHQLDQRIGRLTDSVQAQLTDAADRRRSQLEAMRVELEAALTERMLAVAQQADQAAERVAGLGADVAAEVARTAAFEDRLRTAVTRLGESLEARLADAADVRLRDLDALRSQLHAAAEERVEEARAVAASMIESVVERLEGVAGRASQSADAVAALSAAVDARLAEVASGRQAEAVALRAEVHGAVEERLRPVADRASEVAEAMAAVSAAVQADAARSEAFEERVRAAIAALTDSVDARMSEAGSARQVEVEGLRIELQRAFDDRLQDVAAEAARATEGIVALGATAEADAARTEAFEDRVRAAVARLTESVDARLTQAAEDRERALEGFRFELRTALDERLLPVVDRADELAAGLATVTSALDAESGRSDAFEERVRSVVSRVTESVEALAATATATATATAGPEELESLRAELQAAVEARTAAVAREASEGLAGLTSTVEAQAGRFEAFEERVRAAVTALTESVDSRLADVAATRQGEMEAVRQQAVEAVASLTASLEAEAARTEAFEHRVRAAMGRLSESVEARAAAGGTAELQAEIQAALGQQLTDARTQIASAVAGANKRFVRAHEQLTERMDAVDGRVAASAEKVDGLVAAVGSGAGRLEALELHIGRIDERLAQLAEASAAGMTADGTVGRLAAVRAELQGTVAEHFGDLRAELAAAEQDRADAATRVEDRVGELAGQVAAASAALEAVTAALAAGEGRFERLEKRGRQLQERLSKAVEARPAETGQGGGEEGAALSAELARLRADLDTATAAQARKAERAQAQLRKGVDDLAGRVDDLAAAVAAAASAEKGALAPLRSDVRQLQVQVAELTDALSEATSRRRPPAATAERAAPGVRPAAARRAAAKAAPPAKRAPRVTKNGQ